ncbi:GNAT family N-acetyltransferase [Citreimonas salinaria]|uniref:L-amino acid N-acyltransferase YncA n=1 Tax=Citreimonas salinaria TaxID=321339 RepID=A0A1H3M8M9_9RHOB|nr:GNAT family N-acetyltransferase [Citreimonas salinaria]SDY72638.1 L-amino acid N-acyltransferase YncA [Citreimonas salinaria]
MTAACAAHAPLLRPALPTDAGAVGDILSDFIDSTPWMPRIDTRAEDLAHAAMLVDRGWVTLAETPQADPGPRVLGFLARQGCAIHALYLARPARGRGIGRVLLADAQARADRLSLWTFAANAPAQRFYERAGFAPVERTDGENEEGLPDIRYLWERPAP